SITSPGLHFVRTQGSDKFDGDVWLYNVDAHIRGAQQLATFTFLLSGSFRILKPHALETTPLDHMMVGHWDFGASEISVTTGDDLKLHLILGSTAMVEDPNNPGSKIKAVKLDLKFKRPRLIV